MTEAEIMKALECISGEEIFCRDCAYNCGSVVACHKKSAKDTLDLINRKNAEIEDLGNRIVKEYQNGYKTARAEAIKEFAERAKEESTSAISCNTYDAVIRKEHIDQLAKEMGVEL